MRAPVRPIDAGKGLFLDGMGKSAVMRKAVPYPLVLQQFSLLKGGIQEQPLQALRNGQRIVKDPVRVDQAEKMMAGEALSDVLGKAGTQAQEMLLVANAEGVFREGDGGSEVWHK